MNNVINSMTKFAIDLLVKTIALVVELHLSMTRVVKNAGDKKHGTEVEDFNQTKALGEQPGPVASGPDSHDGNGNCDQDGCCPTEDFTKRT